MGVVWGHGGVPTHMHMHAHTPTHMYTCIEVAIAANMEASMFIMFTTCLTWMCVHVCMYAHACVHGTPTHTHTDPHPHTPIHHPPGMTPGISQNSITLELIKIFQFYLKI